MSHEASRGSQSSGSPALNPPGPSGAGGVSPGIAPAAAGASRPTAAMAVSATARRSVRSERTGCRRGSCWGPCRSPVGRPGGRSAGVGRPDRRPPRLLRGLRDFLPKRSGRRRRVAAASASSVDRCCSASAMVSWWFIGCLLDRSVIRSMRLTRAFAIRGGHGTGTEAPRIEHGPTTDRRSADGGIDARIRGADRQTDRVAERRRARSTPGCPSVRPRCSSSWPSGPPTPRSRPACSCRSARSRATCRRCSASSTCPTGGRSPGSPTRRRPRCGGHRPGRATPAPTTPPTTARRHRRRPRRPRPGRSATVRCRSP